ncbi:MAG: hypothetical protein AAEJ52_15560 [Myxococcota bacterium]
MKPTPPDRVTRLREMNFWVRLAVTLVALIASGVLCLALLPAPWVWIGVSWFGVSWTASWLSPNRSASWFSIGIACLVIGLLEANAQFKTAFRYEPDRTGIYAGRDDLFGYAPRLTGRIPMARFYGDDVVFDVVYTLDSNHLRVSNAPNSKAEPTGPCVLFFGGSYTYGEGVEDHETLPWQVGLRTRAHIVNFGFQGYGPHQMLSAIESGHVARVIDCKPTHAIYQTIIDHVNRAAGITYWDRHGPRYRLAADGSAVRDGNFDDEVGPLGQLLWDQAQKSLIVKRISQRRRGITPDEMALFHAIVDTSQRLLSQQFPGISFHTIVWDRSGDPSPEFWDGLAQRNLAVHRMSQIMPERRDGELRFEISPYDRHPNALVYETIAHYAARHILD